jgi:cell cycle sensor histidine kinase DivJ
VRDNYLSRAAAKDVAIGAVSCPSKLVVAADENVLTNMLNALLDNALTFIQRGGRIELSAESVDGKAQLRIQDNGPGVAATDLNRILQPFEHAGKVADHAKGAGLGLTLVKAFAELHGGALAVESVFGEGFQAIVTLPAA